MDLKITDKNDNIIYQNMTMYNDDAEEISEDEIEMIIKSIGDSSSNIFNFEYVYNEDNYHYSFLKHTDKDSALDELLELIDVYNSHVAALPEYNPAEHEASAKRESVSGNISTNNDDFIDFLGRLEPWYRPADGLNDETVERMWDLYRRYPGRDYWMRPYSWMKKVDCDGWCDIVKPKRNDNGDSLFGHFECRLNGAGCEGRGGRGGREDVFGCDGHVKRSVINDVLPGSFAGSDKFSKQRDDSCERGSCEGASDDVEPVEEWELTETQKHEISVLKDFIGYLRTQPTWAALIGKLNYYNDPDDEIGKQKLIDDFCEYMENRENQA